MKASGVRLRRFMLLGGLMLLFAPANALAVSAGVNGDTLVIVGGNEANTVDIDGTDMNVYYVKDTAGVTAEAGCTVNTDVPDVLDCGDASTVNVQVQLGGGDDSINDSFMFGQYVWHHPLNQFLVDTGEGNNHVQLFQSTPLQRGIITGDGNNTISVAPPGSGGKDLVGVGNGTNTINLAGGTNEVDLGNGDNTVNGGNGADTIVGGTGHNVINEGTSCNAGDCGVGSPIIEAVDGGADQITCGLGADIVYADQFDTLSSDCTNVHHVTVGTGAAAKKPHAKAYKATCVRRAGHKTCTPAAPLHNHGYHGRTAQGQRVAISTDKHGKDYATKGITVNFLCKAGDGEHALSASDVLSVKFSDHQKLARNGTFSTEEDFDPGEGFSHEVIYIVGAFDGRHARGMIVGNTQYQGQECSSGPVAWSAG